MKGKDVELLSLITFWLGEEVGQEDLMVLADLVVCLHGGDEVTRNHLRALMDELVKGMLLCAPESQISRKISTAFLN